MRKDLPRSQKVTEGRSGRLCWTRRRVCWGKKEVRGEREGGRKGEKMGEGDIFPQDGRRGEGEIRTNGRRGGRYTDRLLG